MTRDCENCANHADGGCTKWECEFAPTLRKGKWVKTKSDLAAVKDESKVWWRCSSCNSPALMGRRTIYCPNCGADMRPDNAPLADDDSIYG